MLNEVSAGYRQVFTDGRPMPEDPNPSWQGYSSGRWEDTLLVETIGFRDDWWLDMSGSPVRMPPRCASACAAPTSARWRSR